MGHLVRGGCGRKIFAEQKRERKEGGHQAAGTYTAEHLPVQCSHTNTAIMPKQLNNKKVKNLVPTKQVVKHTTYSKIF